MNSLDLLPVGFVASYVFILGLCIGSFLNVVVIRGLKGESMVFERSKCPKCGTKLKWYMNIPLLSFIFLRGKCAFCSCRISFQYPIVEFICACLFLAAYFAFGLGLKMFFMWVIFSLFIAMSATDIKETVIIDIHAYILLGVGLLYSFLGLGEINIYQSLLGAFFGFVVFEAMARLGKLFCGTRMFGEGDSLIALGLGAIFGWKNMLIIIALSIFIQAVCAIPYLIFKSYKERKRTLAISYGLVFFSIVLLILTNYFNLAKYQELYLCFVAFVSIVLLWALKNIIFEIRNKKYDDTKDEEEKFSLLPFGPALLIASTVCIFYLSSVKSWISSFI